MNVTKVTNKLNEMTNLMLSSNISNNITTSMSSNNLSSNSITNNMINNGSQSRIFKLSEIAATAVLTNKVEHNFQNLSNSFINCNQLNNKQSIGEQHCSKSKVNIELNLERNELNIGNGIEKSSVKSSEKCRTEKKSNKSQDLKDCLTDGEHEQKQTKLNDQLNSEDQGSKNWERLEFENSKLDPNMTSDQTNDDLTSSINDLNKLKKGNLTTTSYVNTDNTRTGQLTKLARGESEKIEGELVKEKLNYSKEEELIRTLVKKRKINQSATYGKAEEDSNKLYLNEFEQNLTLNKELVSSTTVQQRLDQVKYNLLTNNDLLNTARNLNNNRTNSSSTRASYTMYSQNGKSSQPIDGQLSGGHANIFNVTNDNHINEHKKEIRNEFRNDQHRIDRKIDHKTDYRSDHRSDHRNDTRNDHRNEPRNNLNSPQQVSTLATATVNNISFENPILMKKINSTKRLRLSHSPNLESQKVNSNSSLSNSSTNLLFNDSLNQSGKFFNYFHLKVLMLSKKFYLKFCKFHFD